MQFAAAGALSIAHMLVPVYSPRPRQIYTPVSHKTLLLVYETRVIQSHKLLKLLQPASAVW